MPLASLVETEDRSKGTLHTPMGSPRGVPVPCTAMAATSVGARSADDMAAEISAFCEGPFGAVSEDDLPSWLIAEPCNLAKTFAFLFLIFVRRWSYCQWKLDAV